MQKIYILTEGGAGIGLGHVTRCLAIYKELQKHQVEVEIIIDKMSELLLQIDGEYQYTDWKNMDFLQGFLTEDDQVVIDSYLASINVYEWLVKNVKRLWIIDDNCRLDFPEKATVINPSLNAKTLGYSKKTIENDLLGISYAILREAFQKVEYIEIKKSGQWLVTFGGTDLLNVTPRLIREICTQYPKKIFKIIVGSDYHNINEIQIEMQNVKNVILLSNVSAFKMRKLMQESEGVISACGQTIYELLRLRTFFIPVQIVDNQINNAKGLEQIGIPVCHSFEDLKIRFEEVLKTGFPMPPNLVDGQGVRRIVRHMIGK